MGLFDWLRKRQASSTPLEHEDLVRTDSSGASGKKRVDCCAYDRGMAHLKCGEYAQAVAAFGEAIKVDPESPNAYVGRALAHRSLGDDAAALRDEETARKLGGPEQSAWDRLVNQANRRWRGDLRDPNWHDNDPLSRNAFLLRQWSWQILNGGLAQWVANGYGEWTEDLARAAQNVGTDSAREVTVILRDLAQLLRSRPGTRAKMIHFITTQAQANDEETEIFELLSRYEDRYHRVEGTFDADVEAWLENQAGEAP
jgi:hypothetical protein